MIPILYEATELNFTSNGVCRLAEATECHVTEERNGEYELTLTYPITGKYYDQIQEGMYIAATHDDQGDRQPFRIYRRSAPFNGLVQFFAHHISYALNNIILNPITATSAADAFDQMEEDTVTANPFTMWTDVVTAGDFKTDTPTSIRSALGGVRGSILDVYGGEYEWDMFTVELHANRGVDSGVTIRYGKNLTDLNQVIDAGSVYNAIVPYWFGSVNDIDTLITLPEHYVAATGVTSPVMVVMDFTSDFDNPPTEAQLRSAASSYLSINRPWIPSENIEISFVQLWQTEEYKDVAVLQRLSMCDRVNVYYPAMGITAEGVKIIKTVYNVLLDRYDVMELGEARSTFADTLIDPVKSAIEEATRSILSKSYVQAAIDYATQMITGGMGGNIVYTFDANGWPIEQLMMDTKDKNTAVNVWRWNLGGFGHSHNGYDGPFDDIAITQDGKINADMITVGTMSANRIKGGTLSLGGLNNGNGVMIVYDASGAQVGKIDKDGISISSGTISGPNIILNADDVTGALGDMPVYEFITYIDGNTLERNYSGEGFRVKTKAHPKFSTYISPKNITCYANNTIDTRTNIRDKLFWDLGENHWYIEDGTNLYYHTIAHGDAFGMSIGRYSLASAFPDDDTEASRRVSRSQRVQVMIGSGGLAVGNGLISLTTDAAPDCYIGSSWGTWYRAFATSSAGTSNYGVFIDYRGATIILQGSRDSINSHSLKYTSSGLVVNGNTVAYQSTSAKRYKHNIELLHDEELDPHRLYSLKAKQFRYNVDVFLQYKDMYGMTLPGFIAEDVAEIYPAAVIHNVENPDDIESWDERRIIPPMLSLIQEQHEQIEALTERVNQLEALVNQLINERT